MEEKNTITFVIDEKPVLELVANGEIYWNGRLIITDEELVSALRDVVKRYSKMVQ